MSVKSLAERKIPRIDIPRSNYRFRTGIIQINSKKLNVYIADTSQLRLRGLQLVDELEPNWGMFFIFPEPVTPTMTNLNTRFPIDIAFFDRNYYIRDIQSMPAHDNNNPVIRKAPPKTLFALEVNKGWFESKGINKNARLKILAL